MTNESSTGYLNGVEFLQRGWIQVTRVVYLWCTPASILAAATLSPPACGWGHLDTVTPPDTEDTSEDDDTSVDSETPPPCGEGAPADCVEIVGGTCWVPALRPSWEDLRFNAEAADVAVSNPATTCDGTRFGDCDYFAALACDSFVSTMRVSSEGDMSGEPVLLDDTEYSALFYDESTGAIRSVGIVVSPQHREGPCAWTLYGDRGALPCFDRQRALINERYASCASTYRPCYELCDVCPCRINELSDALPDGCESPSR